MNRRRLLKLGGLITIGGSFSVGTGAFTSVNAQRQVKIGVADDDSAYLALNATSEKGRASDVGDPDKIAFAIPSPFEDTIGNGVGQDSVYEFANILNVRNQGDDAVIVWSESSPAGPVESVSLASSGNVLSSKSDGIELSPGEEFSAGLVVETGTAENTGNFDTQITVRAEVSGIDNFPGSDVNSEN